MPKELTLNELIKQGFEKIKSEMDDFVWPFAKHNAHTPPDITPQNLDLNPKPTPQTNNSGPRNITKPWKSRNPRNPRNPRNSKNPVPYPSRQPNNAQYPPRGGGVHNIQGDTPNPTGWVHLVFTKPPLNLQTWTNFYQGFAQSKQPLRACLPPASRLLPTLSPFIQSTLPLKTLESLESELGNFFVYHSYSPRPTNYYF
jgi:hypothetical protein